MLTVYRYFGLAQEGILITKLTAKNLQRTQFLIFFGAFAKLRKANISLVMPLCPSVSPHGATLLPLDGYSCNLILDVFRKPVEKIAVSFKSDKNNGYVVVVVGSGGGGGGGAGDQGPELRLRLQCSK
jgi:hypothetical protein